jgi:hypothetical protein
MTERSKVLAWNASVVKATVGSNPTLSAWLRGCLPLSKCQTGGPPRTLDRDNVSGRKEQHTSTQVALDKPSGRGFAPMMGIPFSLIHIVIHQYKSNLTNRPSIPPFLSGFLKAVLRPMFLMYFLSPK